MQSLQKVGAIAVVASGLSLVGLVGGPIAVRAQQFVAFPTGLRCEGTFTGLNGNGTCAYKDGYYRGEIRNGLPNGQGTFVYISDERQRVLPRSDEGGSSSTGGSSKIEFASRYEGEFRNGTFNGNGRFYYKNGDRYEGTFRDGVPFGRGTLSYSNGSQYQGDFREGVPFGRGTYTLVNKDRYVGEFRSGLPHGQVTYVFMETTSGGRTREAGRYSGQFFKGVPNGPGTLTTRDGTRCSVVFSDASLSGTGTCQYGNGDSYTGDLRLARPHGRGSGVLGGRRFAGDFLFGYPIQYVGGVPKPLTDRGFGGERIPFGELQKGR